MYPDHNPKQQHANASIFVTFSVSLPTSVNSCGKNACEQTYNIGVIKTVVKSNCKFKEIYTLSVDEALKQ